MWGPVRVRELDLVQEQARRPVREQEQGQPSVEPVGRARGLEVLGWEQEDDQESWDRQAGALGQVRVGGLRREGGRWGEEEPQAVSPPGGLRGQQERAVPGAEHLGVG